ncbi:MAG TPA: protein-glutamate O-methyltransferase CheR [Blastocatellia bacterium]|nr:protein-glutamate O-methyltransferase CheR [Blastocatellia bacterium]
MSRGPVLDAATFQRLRARITSASGILVLADENSRFLLERRLQPRLRQRGTVSFADYEAMIDTGELDALLDTVAVHETYFFREKRQLRAFNEHIVPEMTRSGSPVRIWSAGCSTGEEAYTIAMLMADRGLLGGGRLQLLATDLSRRVIESGQRGLYGASSFRTTEPEYKQRYFDAAGRGLWQAGDGLRAAVRFEQANLVGADAQRIAETAGGSFDAVFCRNVLMYFDEQAVRQTLELIYSLLKDGGYLLLGHAESLLPLGSGFKPAQFGRELVHRK